MGVRFLLRPNNLVSDALQAAVDLRPRDRSDGCTIVSIFLAMRQIRAWRAAHIIEDNRL
jgi:hypothetical protein